MRPWSELEDATLVERALGGEQEGYRELVLRYERPVFSLIVRMVRDAATAEDLSQEAFVKAFGALERYEPNHRFSSWLFKIAHNATIDFLRRKPIQTTSLDATAGADELDRLREIEDERAIDPERSSLGIDLGRQLEVAIGRLRPEYREVVVLRFVEELAYEEIAEVTGLPMGTVKTFLHRARKELAELLGQVGWGPGETAA